jgi:hypothetical protein
MMPEISLNILDITENSIKSKADKIEIVVSVQTIDDNLTVVIQDNGSGMTIEQLEKVQDPFYTTRTTRKVGLGVPFLKQAAIGTGGTFKIDSKVGEGTVVEAVFNLSHIDRMPLGDMTATIFTLVVFNEDIQFRYTYKYNNNEFTLDTKEIRDIIGEELSFQEPEISLFIKEYLEIKKSETDGGKEL